MNGGEPDLATNSCFAGFMIWAFNFSPDGLSENGLTKVRHTLQRFFRYHRSRGSDERAQRFGWYVDDIAALMRQKGEAGLSKFTKSRSNSTCGGGV